MVIPTEVHDKDGNLLRIEFYDLEGEFVIQTVWDENDEQTSENRINFRKWSYRMVEQTGQEIVK